MFEKAKKFFIAFLSVLLAVSMVTAPVCADGVDFGTASDDPGIEPRWQNTMATAAALDFDGSTIYISFSVTGYSGTTFSNGTVTLLKYSGDNVGVVKVWTGLSSNSNIFDFSDDSLTATSGTYRVHLSITATRNGVSETITAKKDRTY